MKKIMLLLVPLLLTGAQMLQAQRTITGTIIGAEDNQGIPGVSVMVKGTTTGTTTNVMGQYSLNVPNDATTLVFSFLGMETQEIAIDGQTTIDVVMKSGSQALEGVVVTALGISRSEKGLSYAVTQVDNQELVRGGDRSALNALQSKVAGVSITSNSGAPGSSSRILLRGFSSVSGSNEPLFVVDGVPVANSASQATGLNNSVDFGNAVNDINPNDIASMTLLKGASASALYGSRAANGVILITTKSGSARDRIKVDYSGTVNFTNYTSILTLQEEFGQGWSGHFAWDENGSWGPKFDGKDRLFGRVINGAQQYKPFTAQSNNMKDFFETGVSFNNSISVSGGNEKTTFYASYSNVKDNGIIPTDADSYTRNAITVNAKTKGKHMTVSSSINYMQKHVSAVGGGQGYSVFNNVMQIPRDFSIVDMADYKSPFNDINGYYTAYGVLNPYWTINEDGNDFDENHVYGNVKIDIPLHKWVTFSARLGDDFLTNRTKQWTAIVAPALWSQNYGSSAAAGGVTIQNYFRNELNGDAYLTFNPEVGDFTISGLAGINVNHRYTFTQLGSVSSLILPNFYNLSNSADAKTATSTWTSRRLVGAYAQADIDYKRQLFLNLAARNDWSSTLPKEANAFFYPSVGLSWLFTETFAELQKYLTLGKVRASYGTTGNDAGLYQLESVMTSAGSLYGAFGGGLAFPLGGVSAYRISNTIGKADLKPELTKEFEAGLDLRFFNNRAGIDMAVYKRNTYNQIMALPIAASSGYNYAYMNVGNVENKGIEIMLKGTPIQTQDLSWDLGVTFTKNNNTVIELGEDSDEFSLYGLTGGASIWAEVGESFAYFRNYGVQTTDDGKIIVDANGLPLAATAATKAGNSQHDFTMGFNTMVTYRGFYLSAQFDWRKGGLFFSRTADINDFVGNNVRTTYNDRAPFIVPNSVMPNPLWKENGSGEGPQYIENTKIISYDYYSRYWDNGNSLGNNAFLIDRSSFRAREIVLGYQLPTKYLSKTPFSAVDFSVVGRNLFVWVPSSNTFIDPDVTTFGNGVNAQYGEFSGYPATRSWGFSLKVSF